MLPGKHGLKRKGSKEIPRTMPSSSKVKELEPVEPEDLENSPGSQGGIRGPEGPRSLVRYAAVLARGKEDGVGMEDLGALQLELESLLVNVALRHRSLLDDIAQIKSTEEKRDKKNKLPSQKSFGSPSNSLKRGPSRGEDRPTKKLKEAVKAKPSSGSAKLNKLKEFPSRDSPKPESSKIVAPKNDTPNKFWSSVDPYCAQITADDQAYLAEQIRIREEERSGDFYTIPPLGKHYSLRWAEEDLAEEAKRPVNLGGTAGPMVQRLVSGLIEENVTKFDHDGRVPHELSNSRSNAVRHVQSLSFEKRVREELREQGILDGDEAPKEQADDELLLEMKRVQSELKALTSHNLLRLRHLQSLADAQVERQELKKKLFTLDTEVLNIHANKQKKKIFNDKEKEYAWRIIKERETLLKQLYPNSTT